YAECVDSGHMMSVGQCDYQPAINYSRNIRQHHQPAVWLAVKFTDSTLDIGSTVNRRDYWGDRGGWCRGFDQARIIRASTGGQFRIEYEGNALDARRDLFEQLQPFAGQRGLDIRESGRVATRTCEAFDEAFPNGVRDYGENDRGCTRLPQDRSCHWRASGQNHVGLECNKLLCKRLHPFRVTGYPTDVDLQIGPFAPA